VVLGQNLVLLRADGTRIYPPFLRWLVRGPEWWVQIGKFLNVGAVFDSLKCADIPNFELHVPPISEQRAIARVLDALDKKIELNRQSNEALLALGEALFKSWFVDFEPVHAKSEQRAINFSDEIADLFPSTFEVLNSSKVPSGWRVGCYGDFTSQRRERVGGRSATILSAVATGRLVASDDHFTKKVYSDDTKKYLLVEQWDFAYNPSRINIGSIGLHYRPFTGAVSPVYVVLRPRASYRWFLEFCLRRSQTKEWINSLASGSVRQALSYAAFSSIPCVLPPEPLLEMFNVHWSRLRARMMSNDFESQILTSLRDTLLPALIAGQVQLKKEVERQVEVVRLKHAFSESVVEEAALDWLEALDYAVLHGPPNRLRRDRRRTSRSELPRRDSGS